MLPQYGLRPLCKRLAKIQSSGRVPVATRRPINAALVYGRNDPNGGNCIEALISRPTSAAKYMWGTRRVSSSGLSTVGSFRGRFVNGSRA